MPGSPAVQIEPQPAPPVDWETFPHGADIGVRGYGATPAEAFANAALAMTSVVADPGKVRCERTVEVACAAPDLEVLLLDWLNRIVGAMATDLLLFGRFEVAIADGRLTGKAIGEPVDIKRHRPAVEVKGATFTELRVAADEGGRWRAQCVVDV